MRAHHRLNPFSALAFCAFRRGIHTERRAMGDAGASVEACRSRERETLPGDLRRTISAILRRHQNGAKSRDPRRILLMLA